MNKKEEETNKKNTSKKTPVRHLSKETVETIKKLHHNNEEKETKAEKIEIFGRKYTKRIIVKMTEAEYVMLKGFADRKKVTISDVVRSGIAYIIGQTD